jgi:putative oxidoreductase
MDARTNLVQSIGLLILRLGAGGFLATHGWGKVQMVIKGQFDNFPDPLHIGSKLSLISAAGAEFVCSILVMIGLATRLAALPPAFAMAVAAFVIHKADPLLAEQGFAVFKAGQSEFPKSKEPALMFLIPFLALVFTGPGLFSIDGWLWPRFRARKKAPAPE